MNTEFSYLYDQIKKHIKENGEKPLTNAELLSIMYNAMNKMEEDEKRRDVELGFDPH
jgi:hypothetical protein